MAADRMFTIHNRGSNNPEGFSKYWHGTVSNGRQVLVGWVAPDELVCLWFDAKGRFLKTQPFRESPEIKGQWDGQETKSQDDFIRRFLDWMKGLGFRAAPIRVKHFFVSEPMPVAPRILIDPTLDQVCDPHLSTPKQRASLFAWLKTWISSGAFLLVLGNTGEPEMVYDDDAATASDPRITPTGTDPASTKLYPLRTHGAEGGEADFYTGTLPDGRQAVMGPADYQLRLLCVTFDPDGNLLEALTQPLPLPPVAKKLRGKAQLPPFPDPAQERARAIPHLLAWQQQLGWKEGPIRVRAFMLPDDPVYIAALPRWGIVTRYDPYFYPDPQERTQMRQQLAEWEASGNFVFWWGRDYHMSKDGEVLST
jgi:hypothetical protein